MRNAWHARRARRATHLVTRSGTSPSGENIAAKFARVRVIQTDFIFPAKTKNLTIARH